MKSKSEKRPIRVLRLLSRMNVGGPSLHVLHLTRELDRRGFETRLAVGEPRAIEGSMIGLARDLGVEPIIIPGLDRPIDPLKDLRAFAEILRLIIDFRPDIVHTHTAKAGILGRMAAVMCRVPVIVHTFHGHVFEGYFEKGVSRGIIGLERVLARLSDLIITLSPFLREDLLRYLRIPRSEKVRVVPLGLDLSSFLLAVRHKERKDNMPSILENSESEACFAAEEVRGSAAIPNIAENMVPQMPWRDGLGLPAESILLGIVARLVPVKNHCGLLDAFALLARKDARLHLAIVGGGECEEEIRKSVERHGLLGRVHLTGIESSIQRVYADLDLLVLASHNEGTPVVLIEALATGCPVAATDVGGVRELLDGGRLGAILRKNPAGFFEDLEGALRRLPQLEWAAHLGRLEIQDRFRIDHLVDHVADLYGEVLQRRGKAEIVSYHS
ncbi:MAG: glycosyltransferase [Candidatus Ozemobacteraceae bacterium]